MAEQKMFDIFQKSNQATWKSQAIKDLKGKNFDETLVWQTPAGFSAQPYYTSENTSSNKLPIQASWQNMPYIVYQSEKKTNSLIINYLKNGADGIYLDFKDANVQTIQFPVLFHGIKINETPIIFSLNESALFLIQTLQNLMPYRWRGGLLDKTVSKYLQTGKTTVNTWKNTKLILEKIPDNEWFKVLNLDLKIYQEAGANAVQELAFTLATVATYLDKLTDLGLPAERVAKHLQITIGVGTNYFFEIAKLRALRILLNQLLNDFGIENVIIPIHAETVAFFDSTATPYTNLLRRSTEAMAAVIGGCDGLTVRPYNFAFAEADDFAERIARNISVLLKEESYLDRVADPSAGSYYIENLTNQITENTWALFLDIENRGGLLEIAENGTLRQWIDEAFVQQEAQIEAGKILVGVNKFRFDESEIIKMEKEVDNIPAWCLPKRRLAEKFE